MCRARVRVRRCRGYTAFGSGVSTEISASAGCAAAGCGYTAFGSGVSTEIKMYTVGYSPRPMLHSLRLRGEH